MGVPHITLVAYDEGQDLIQTGAKNWGSVSSSEVARQIAVRHGLTADVVDSGDARRESRIQSANTTDYEMLSRLALRINYDFWVDNGVLHFRPINTDASPMHRFVYFVDGGGILKSFQPTVKKGKIHRRHHAGVTSDGRPEQSSPRRVNRALAGYQVQRINHRAASLAGVEIRGGTADDTHVSPSPETSSPVRRMHASSDQAAAELGSVAMTAELVGYPGVRPRDVIEVYVVERRYSGLWRVDEFTDRISSRGYDTQLRLCRAEINANGMAQSDAVVPRNERNAAANNGASQVPMFEINTRSVVTNPTMAVVRQNPSVLRGGNR
jgi:phage protein D